MAEINVIKYSSELQKQLFPDNSFYKKSIGETGIADTTKTVERPIQGSIGKARSGEIKTLPLKVKVALDDSDSYPTTLVYADPLAVNLPSEIALSYNKRQAKQVQQAGVINTRIADIAATNWGPTLAANILKTSGASRASNVSLATGDFIGNRKAATKADMVAVHNLLQRMNIGSVPGSFCGLVTADFYSDLLKLTEFTDYEKTGYSSKLEQGILGKIMGIEIGVRATETGDTGLVYSSSFAKKGIDDAIISTDCPGNLFWHSGMTCRAEGILKTSIDENKPEYLGATVISSWVRFGASWGRKDQKGVVALLENNAG